MAYFGSEILKIVPRISVNSRGVIKDEKNIN